MNFGNYGMLLLLYICIEKGLTEIKVVPLTQQRRQYYNKKISFHWKVVSVLSYHKTNNDNINNDFRNNNSNSNNNSNNSTNTVSNTRIEVISMIESHNSRNSTSLKTNNNNNVEVPADRSQSTFNNTLLLENVTLQEFSVTFNKFQIFASFQNSKENVYGYSVRYIPEENNFTFTIQRVSFSHEGNYLANVVFYDAIKNTTFQFILSFSLFLEAREKDILNVPINDKTEAGNVHFSIFIIILASIPFVGVAVLILVFYIRQKKAQNMNIVKQKHAKDRDSTAISFEKTT